MSEEKEPRIAKKVLFVKNLPYDTKDDEFEKAFSDIGPIRKSFLVREKGLFIVHYRIEFPRAID